MKLVVGQVLSKIPQAQPLFFHLVTVRIREPIDFDLAQERDTNVYSPLVLPRGGV